MRVNFKMSILNLDVDFEKLFEDDSDDYGYYNASEDTYNKMDSQKVRQQKLTLRMLNRLKRIRKTRKLEQTLKREVLGAMYGVPKEEG